jgi:hypothetical protein
MDSIQVIQHFFAKMRCNFCHSHFEPAGVHLVREEEGVFIVDVSCCQCERHAGLAMVSVDKSLMPNYKPRFQDPELTPAELDRLAIYEPISSDDVLDAHHFIQDIESNWKKYLTNRPDLTGPKGYSKEEAVQQEFDFNLG